jgi:hypothetical protein
MTGETRKTDGKKPREKRAPFETKARFVNRELTVEEGHAVKAQPDDGTTLLVHLDALCDAGYKVTFRWEDRNRAYACWLIAPDDDPVNGGGILPGRGSSVLKALKQVMYKHYEIFKEDWGRGKAVPGLGQLDD